MNTTQNLNDKPSGLICIPGFVSSEFSNEIVNAIDSQDWQTNMRRRVQHYGWRYDYKSRRLNQSDWLGPLPSFIMPVIKKLLEMKFFTTTPDQVIVNEYEAGQGIAAHVDCEPCFGDTVASLSLLSPCVMRFRKRDQNGVFYDLDLSAGSLLILKNDARYEWSHEIAARKNDTVNGHKRSRERRISLTFRTVKLHTT